MSTGARVDLFSLIHKGVRRSLFETAMEVSRTDFATAAEVGRAEQAVRRCFGFLREHADHEDREMTPSIMQQAPELAASLAAEHVVLDKSAIAIDSLLPRLGSEAPGDRLAMGAELQRRFNILVAEQLRHLDREEREANAVLWANLSDDSLAAIRERIMARMAPERLAEWLALVGPALSGRERDALARARPTA
jgi:hypothetical protein